MAKTLPKILIIEDEDSLASVLLSKFKKEGYLAKVEPDGEAGLKRIDEWKPDMILLDIVMPKINGYEVLARLSLSGNKTPVIIISNSGQKVEIEKTKQLGAVDAIVKTEFDPNEVVEKAGKYLSENGFALPAKSSAKKDQKEKTDGKSKGPSVLLVEDDPVLRDICVKKMIHEGYDVHTAVEGEQALEEIEKAYADIILLDIILPNMDGFQILEKIKKHKKAKVKKIPVIMLTNLGQEEDVKKAMQGGAANYLVKAHFTTDEIISEIKKHVQ